MFLGTEKISYKSDLALSLELEDFLRRSIDLIDINDEYIENIIKIEALNSDMIIMKDEKFSQYLNSSRLLRNRIGHRYKQLKVYRTYK